MESLSIPASGWVWISLILLFFTIETIASVFFHQNTQGRTFSAVLRGWAVVGLAAPMGWGMLAGHFFHPWSNWRGIIKASVEDVSGGTVILVAVAPIALFAIIDVLVAFFGNRFVYPRWTAPVVLGVGVLWGALIWPVS